MQNGKAAQQRYDMLTQTPVPQLILKLSVPTIISMLVTGIYNTADTYFVGKISTADTAAVGIVFSMMAMIQALGFFFGHGSGNYLSRMLGAGEEEEARNMASTGFVMAAMAGVVLAVLGIVFAYPLAYVLGAEATSVDKTVSYMRIILMGAPFMVCQFVINNQLRFQGSAIYAMVGLFSGAIVNIALDPILIFGFRMGISGAALATISAQMISFFVLFAGTRKGANIRLSIKHIHINLHYLKEIVNGGAPSLLRQGLAAVATLLMNNLARDLGGDAAIAAMSIVTRAVMMIASVMIGFGQGFQPVCSFNYGAKLVGRVREGFFFCVRYGFLFLSLAAILLFVFAEPVIYWFRPDPEVVEIGKVAMRWQAVALPIFSVSSMINMMLQSMGRGVKASITASARSGLCFIPLLLILTHFFGLFGLEIAQACADIAALLISIPLAADELRKMNRDVAEEA
ncbi:MAG: MATE family efflux transporter [Lachnospiraceae bacterium]|nr:MATE family efflux transporter [Lachnospiraceae bacterium]